MLEFLVGGIKRAVGGGRESIKMLLGVVARSV